MSATATTSRLLPHERILASAGSGKTYQLASRYVRLLAAGASPASILASTFTRTAAAEIRDRVLLRLAEAADDEGACRRLADELGAPELTTAALHAMLLDVAREIHRLEIGTLDAYFASVAGSAALELGIPAGCRIVEETEAAALRAEAIRRVLGGQDVDALVELLRQLTQGGSERSVVRPIDQAIGELYTLYRQADASAWTWLEVPPGRLDDGAVDAAVARLAACPTPANGHHRRAFAVDLDQARRSDWEAFLSAGIAATITAGRAAFHRAPIDEDLAAAYRPLTRHATAVIAGRLRRRTEAARELLRRYDEAYAQIKRERRTMTFDDLAALAERVAETGGAGDAGRRNPPLAHALLDEFQDTSVPQWRALLPLLQRIVASPEGSVFVVGDLKQSIYGWRDATPEILEELPELLLGEGAAAEAGLVDRTLSLTRRSAPPVIRAVNAVFGSLDGNAALTDDRPAADQWSHAFAPHETVRTDLPGYVELRAVDGEDRDRTDAAARLAAALHRAAPGRRIGVLTRTRREASALLYGLWRESVPASGLGGGSLTEAPAVNAVLDLLTLADHPDDTAAAFHVAGTPLGGVVGAGRELASARQRAGRHALARRVRRTVMEQGYAGAIAGWLPGLAPAVDGRELQRLVQLVDLAGAFDERGGGRCGDLVRLVEAKDVAEESDAPVQVMTVHKSKGLEFDLVILPELEASLSGRS
ncbi:MAG: UvrD-helicase domain-containing protein, partial [Planctomycetota bacterium]